MQKAKNCMVALTELVNDQAELNNLLARDTRFPVLNDNRCKRVGLMVPKYLEHCFQIVDAHSIKQFRKRKSQAVAQITTFKFSYNTIVEYISVVYMAPDASANSKKAVTDKILEYSHRFTNYVALGDFNTNFRTKQVRAFYKAELGGKLTQKVGGITRQKEVKLGSGLQCSNTTIDLCFVSDEMNNRFAGPTTIYKDSPSDHFLVECAFDIKVPKKCAVFEYFLDPTRRPPIPKHILPSVQEQIRKIFNKHEVKIDSMEQHEIFEFVQKTVKTVLDKHNPLNKNTLHKKRIYAFTMSKTTRCLQKVRNIFYNYFRKAKREGLQEATINARYEAYRVYRNLFTSYMRSEKMEFQKSFLERGLAEGNHIWDKIKRFQPNKHVDTTRSSIMIDGKQGTELANYMAEYIRQRAQLVPPGEVIKHSEYIPLPRAIQDVIPRNTETCSSVESIIDIDDNMEYDVEDLFKSKKRANLSCGPDTISHRHIVDLMPVLKPVLQKAIDKPLTKFPDIRRNFNRLISKETVSVNKPLTVKSQRPIAELDILPKYGCIKVFVDQLRRALLPKLGKNQYSFPGKGSPMAIVAILDSFSMQQKMKKKAVLAIYDFSNAYCTIVHKVTMQIAARFNLSSRTLELLKQFLGQTFSTIKMSDKDGFYQSTEINTVDGMQQGQIGSGFIFALVNDNIDPIEVLEAVIERIKYVDDFNDIISSEHIKSIVESIQKNIRHLLRSATSVGLKLNDSKTKFLFLNMQEEEVKQVLAIFYPPDKIETAYSDVLKYTHRLLGFEFGVEHNKISVAPAVDNLVSRLNGYCRIISSMRKHGSSLKKLKFRIDAATNFDLGGLL